MKIVFSTPVYYPTIGGVAFYTQELAEGLVKKGHEVTVYVLGKKGIFEKNGVIVKRFPSKHILRGYRYSFEFLREIKNENADIIHSHHYGYFPAYAGCKAAKKNKIPHVFGPYYHPPIYGIKRKLLSSIYYWFQGKFILKNSDVILPHTEYEKGLLKKIGADENKMILLPNIVDVSVFKPLIKKKNKKRKEKTVLYVSHIMESKGYDKVIEFARHNPDINFIIIGHGDPPDEEIMRSAVKNNKNIIWKKDLKLKELVKWYNKADVFVLPSYYEAFGRVIAEAMACGLPVVSTRVGGIPEVVVDGETGFLVNYGEWDEMERKIKQLLNDDKLRKKMGRNGRNHVVKNFSKEIILNKLERIYGSVL